MNIQYRTCSLCGANLDPDEKCTCETKREERIEDRPKPDTPQQQLAARLKRYATKFNFIMEITKMEKLRGLTEAQSAIVRYKIFRLNYKDDLSRNDYKDINRFFVEFKNAFKDLTPEEQEKEWLFFKGFVAGVEDAERLSNVK